MKAVVKISGKQYLVSEKESLLVDLLPEGTKELALDALLVVDGDKTKIGTPTVKGVVVKAKVIEAEVKGDKIRVIRYKSKKRVHKETVRSTPRFRSLRSNNVYIHDTKYHLTALSDGAVIFMPPSKYLHRTIDLLQEEMPK